MEAVVCPHCSAKIRLTRKKSQSSSPKQTRDASHTKEIKPREAEPEKTKPPRLPVPDFSAGTKATDATQDQTPADDFPDLNPPSKRKAVNLNELQIGDPSEPELPESEQDQGFPEIITRRKKAHIDFGQLDDIATEPANLADLEPERRSPDGLIGEDSVQAEANLADDLLPPKFLVADIESDENAVVLPTAGGGLQVVDKTEVRVMHEGRSVKLVSLSPEELKRVRLIENIVALLIAGIMLAIAVWLVL